MDHGKQMVIRLVEMMTGGLILCFCLLFLWGEHGESLLKEGSRKLLEGAGAAGEAGSCVRRLEELMSHSAPELRAEGYKARVGEPVSLWEKLLVRQGDQWVPLAQQSGITGRMTALYDGEGQALTPVPWQEELPEEIASPVGYDPGQGRLVFFTGGSYRVSVRLEGPYGRKTEALVTFLAEVQ